MRMMLALAAILWSSVAMAGEDPKLWNDKVGFFCPGTPFANDAGLEAVTRRPETTSGAWCASACASPITRAGCTS